VFKRNGLVLFKFELSPPKGDPVGDLIRTVLLETRNASSKQFVHGPHAVNFRLNNKARIVCVAVYQSILSLNYVDSLLESVAEDFPKQHSFEEIKHAVGKLEYASRFEELLNEAENAARRTTRKSRGDHGKSKDSNSGDIGAYPQVAEEEEEYDESEFDQFRRKGLRKSTTQTLPKAGAHKGKNTKRAWNETKALTEEEVQALDVTGTTSAISAEVIEASEMKKASMYLPEEEGERADIDKEEDDVDDAEEAWSFSAKLSSMFESLTGQKPLTKEDLQPAVDAMEKQLQQQNVSALAAREICEAVMQDLVGKKLGSITKGISSLVRESCEKALQRLLTPKRSIDLLREVRAAKEEGRPYTVVFIGVNGVGKSTSLSKVCYYLKNNGVKVMLCACDTFRSGAIEQLKVHAKNLQVPIFEAGYNKDAASVATNGIRHAKETGMDVVLIDTAGRMQNNEPLMRSLTKLVARNTPDLVLFVGEALAGNDSTDQLMMFNRALKDFSESPNPRTIDATILTKFDTISDKVGAAVSMVHSSGQPIIFIGTGQRYTNLNRMNVKKVLKALLD